MRRYGIFIFLLLMLTKIQAQLPNTPVIDSVSVVNGKALISWTPNEVNTEGYLIYHLSGAVRQLIDTVKGIQTSFYIDNNFDPCDTNQAYCVNAYMGNDVSPNGTLYPVGTLFFRQIHFQQCTKTATFYYNNSAYTQDGIIGYKAYAVDTLNNTETLLGEAANGEYIYNFDFVEDVPYCFLIRMFRTNGKTSSSCTECFKAKYPPIPDRLGFRLATVENNQDVQLRFTIDASNPWAGVSIRRTEMTTGNVSSLFSYNGLGAQEMVITDTTALVNQSSYLYEAVALDSCGSQSELPATNANTILLRGYMADANTNHLEWNAYENNQWDVRAYKVIRTVSGLPDTEMIVNASILNFDDNVFVYANLGYDFFYHVEAICSPDATSSETDTVYSVSNEIELLQNPVFEIPNAFTPNGDLLNDEFTPVPPGMGTFKEYHLNIYDRWGKQIFSSANQLQGWNGFADGKLLPTGIYIYHLYYKSLSGKSFEKRGMVTLLN